MENCFKIVLGGLTAGECIQKHCILNAGVISSLSCSSGIIWPVECIPYPLRYLSLALPQTYASEALRCIMYRGTRYTTLIWFHNVSAPGV